MPGVIQIGLAQPDIGAGQVLWTEFVMPAAVAAVDEMRLAEFPEQSVPGFVLRLARAFEQGTGGGTCFGVRPVQAMTDDRLVVPVEGVDDARRTVDIPAVAAVVLEQLLRIGCQPARCEHAGLDPRGFQVQQQPRPLEPVARVVP